MIRRQFQSWAKLIGKTDDVGTLFHFMGGGKMRILSFKETPNPIGRIIRHSERISDTVGPTFSSKPAGAPDESRDGMSAGG
jgi:hypothetical protein